MPLFTLSIAVVTWCAKNGPSVLAILLSMALFDYVFTEPIYSLEISINSIKEVPYFIIFVIWEHLSLRSRLYDGRSIFVTIARSLRSYPELEADSNMLGNLGAALIIATLAGILTKAGIVLVEHQWSVSEALPRRGEAAYR